MDLHDLPDFDKRMTAAEARAHWEIGDSDWAHVILEAFMNPDEDAEELRQEKGEEN